MPTFAASPDDIAVVAALTRADADVVADIASRVGRALAAAADALGPAVAVRSAAEEYARVEGVVLVALEDAVRILVQGFAGAADDYRDAEARLAGYLGREALP